MLDRLPVEVLVHLVTNFLAQDNKSSSDGWPVLLQRTLPAVCRAWRRRFINDDAFWKQLAACHHMTLPRRCRDSLQHAFWQRWRQIQQARQLELEGRIYALSRRLHGGDCASYMRKQLQQYGTICFIVNHAVSSMENRTLLHFACWHGRVRTARLLLEECHANVFALDANGASALLVAAWGGHTKLVRLLLKHVIAQSHNDEATTEHLVGLLHQPGIPPLTSSCGGKGPKTALVWAQRKGFSTIVRILQEAGATV